MISISLDGILSEWAMRSNDGLASGHKTADNIDILKTVLREHGLSKEEASQIASDVLARGDQLKNSQRV